MNQMCGQIIKRNRDSERGEGKVKFIIVLVILFLAGWAGYNYIPVAYQAQAYKQEMDTTVLQVMGLPSTANNPVPSTLERLKRIGKDYGVPEDAVFDVKPIPNGVQANVKFKRAISLLPFYNYDYEFDYTAKTGSFLTQ